MRQGFRDVTRQKLTRDSFPLQHFPLENIMSATSMSARGDTTPSTGELPMSVLWTELPPELVETVLDEAHPKELQLHVTPGAEKPVLKSNEKGILGPDVNKWLVGTLVFATDKPKAWKALFALLSLTKRARERALTAFKTTTIIRFDNEIKAFSAVYPFSTLNIMQTCSSVLVKTQQTVQCTHFQTPCSSPRPPSILRATLTVKLTRGSQYPAFAHCQWERSKAQPTTFELHALRDYVDAVEFRSIYQQALGNLGYADLVVDEERIDGVWKELRSTFNFPYRFVEGHMQTRFIRAKYDGKMVATDGEEMSNLEEKIKAMD